MLDPVNKLLPGMTAGAVGVLVGYPLETLKTQMQINTSTHRPSLSGQFKINTAMRGVRSLYAGMVPSLTSQMIRRSYQFWAFETLKPNTNVYLAGAISGLLGCPISSPFHLIKTKLQLGQYRSPQSCFTSIYRQDGLIGFYRGTGIHTLREVVFSSVYLGSYYHLQRHFRTVFNNGLAVNFLAGSTASLLTWGLLFPLNTVETAIQSGHGIKLVCRKVHRHGLLNLWNGILPVIIRIMPVSGMSMLAYEYTKKTLS